MIVVKEALDGGFLVDLFHALELPIRPWVLDLGQAPLNQCPTLDTLCKLDVVVNQHRMDTVGRVINQTAKKLYRHYFVGIAM